MKLIHRQFDILTITHDYKYLNIIQLGVEIINLIRFLFFFFINYTEK